MTFDKHKLNLMINKAEQQTQGMWISLLGLL